jgi:hypothetical protein
MIVKMNGTRDGHGLRKVVSVENGQIIGRKLEPCYRNNPTIYPNQEIVLLGTKCWKVIHDVTTHGADKFNKVIDYKLPSE